MKVSVLVAILASLPFTLWCQTSELAQGASQHEQGPRKELRELDYDKSLRAFVDPATGKPHTGLIVVSYPDGSPETRGALKDGLEDGHWVEFYEDGTKSAEGTYKKGVEDGKWTYWWDNGKVESEGTFDQGKMIGRWRDFFPDGSVASDGEFVDGKASGEWMVYDDETRELTKVYYKSGEEVAPPSLSGGQDREPANGSSSPAPSPSPTASVD